MAQDELRCGTRWPPMWHKMTDLPGGRQKAKNRCLTKNSKQLWQQKRFLISTTCDRTSRATRARAESTTPSDSTPRCWAPSVQHSADVAQRAKKHQRGVFIVFVKSKKVKEMMKKRIIEIAVKMLVAALTAFLTAITTTSCMGRGPF